MTKISTSKDETTINKGYDFHMHPRESPMREDILPYTANRFVGGMTKGNFARDAIVDTLIKRELLRSSILSIVPKFKPIVPLMITKRLVNNPTEVIEAIEIGGVRVFCFLPSVTTNGPAGLSLYDFYTPEFDRFLRILEKYGPEGVILSIHLELGYDKLTAKDIPPLFQEEYGIPFLRYLLETHPRLKIQIEHASSEKLIDFIDCVPKWFDIGVTITAHHPIRSFLSVSTEEGKIFNPLNYCKPIFKYEQDREAVIRKMCSGDPRYFAGGDSAAHRLDAKMNVDTPAAGIFSAPILHESYADTFDKAGKLERMNDFISVFGPKFHGVEPSNETITLIKQPQYVPEILHGIPVFRGGEEIPWSIAE